MPNEIMDQKLHAKIIWQVTKNKFVNYKGGKKMKKSWGKMKRKIFASSSFLSLVVIAVALPATPVYSFWYGEQSLDDMGYEYETCGDLNSISRALQREMQGFDNNPQGDEGVTISKPDEYWDGITLLSCVGGCGHNAHPGETFYALLIDMQGNFINGWTDINGIPAKLHPGGYVTGGQGGGFGGSALVTQDWCGNEVWRWNVVGGRWHHDHNAQGSPSGAYSPECTPKMDGKRLILCNHTPEDEYEYPKDCVPDGHPAMDTSHISNYGLIDDAFYIVDKKGRIKWQWFAAQHFEQMGFSDLAKDGIMNVNVGRGGRTDWTHFNNVNWLGDNKYFTAGDDRFHPDNLLFDSRTSGMIGIIAHDDVPGKWNKGDIVWQIAPGTPVFSSTGENLGPIIGPHNANMIQAGYPGEGHVLVFDNGGQGCYGPNDYGDVTGCPGTYPNALRDYSRILEIDPATNTVVWMYKCTADFTDADGNLNRKFFSSFISSVQRTMLGTTIFTEGNQARIAEVTPDGEIVWEYIAAAEPGGPGVIGRALYRSYRYPQSWLPEDMTCPQNGN